MSDDRDWSTKPKPKWISLTQYVKDVVSQGAKSQEFCDLVRLYGLQNLEKLLEGKPIKEEGTLDGQSENKTDL